VVTDPPLSRGRTAAIVVGLLLGVLLAALDTTIVSAAIRTIADDLQGLSLQAWATTAYLITSTLSTPLYGKLGDILGRKPMYLAAITIFLVGSVACATSTSMIELAVFRAVQGAGTGGLISLALVIIADIAPGREAAKYQGAFVSVFSMSNLLGPAIGGVLAAQSSILGVAGWRWVFLVNLPVGLAALAVVAKTLRNRQQRQKQRVDWWGTLTISVGVVPLLLVSSEGPDWGWASPGAIACYAASFVGLIAFFFVERRMADAALVPLRLFRERSFVVACLATVVVGAAMLGAMSLYPQYFQIVKGTSASTAGLLMIPVMVGLTVTSGISAVLISKTGRYKIFPLIGIALMSVAMVLFCFVDADTSLFASEAYLTIFGLGLGLSIQPLILTAQNTVPPEDMGVATSLATFFQQMGGIIGTSVVIAAVFGGVVGRISDALRSALTDPAYQAALRSATGVGANLAQSVHDGTTDAFAARVLTDSTFIQQLGPQLARPFLVGFSSSITIGFLIGLVVVVGVVLMFFVRERPLAAAVEASGVEASGVDRSGLDADIPMVEMTVPIPRIDWPSNDFERPPAPFQWFMPTMPGAQIHGMVQHPDGTPIPGVTLVLMDLLGRQVDQYRTGDGGRFGLATPAPGTFLLVATTIGHQPRALMVAATGRPLALRLSLERSDQQHLSGELPERDPDSRPLPRVVRLDPDAKNRHVRRNADEAS
jgi:EmrB/QacA subfamily drug resistance transporter